MPGKINTLKLRRDEWAWPWRNSLAPVFSVGAKGLKPARLNRPGPVLIEKERGKTLPEQTFYSCDILILGGGLAGCTAAIKAREKGADVILVDKSYVSRSGSSAFAAGMINVCLPEDNKEEWLKEIVREGEYLNDQEWVRIHLEETYPLVMELDRWGSEQGKTIFKRNEDGTLKRLRGRGNLTTHSAIVSAIPMMDVLRKKVMEKAVPIHDRTMAFELIMNGDRVAGAVAYDLHRQRVVTYLARTVIMAAAGCGFKSFFIGHRNLTGEGQVMAYNNGALLRDLEQACSNTTARQADIHGNSLMVGLGARFRNRLGDEFMYRYDPLLGNKAINSILTIAFCLEVRADRGPIYMDLTGLDAEARDLVNEIVPEGIQSLQSVGISPYDELIEWIPAFYGTICQGGGININTRCQTSLPGLYAAGDSTCSPQQGTYSVTGLNLSFCLPSGERAARFALEESQQTELVDRRSILGQVQEKKSVFLEPLKRTEGFHPDELTTELQGIMLPYDVCYLRSASTLKKALAEVAVLREEKLPRLRAGSARELIKANELRSMVTVAELILRSCLYREESRGHLFREDFPFTDNDNWLKWVMVRRGDDGPLLHSEACPFPYVPAPQGRHLRIPEGAVEPDNRG